jgi:hypothetical protein
MSKPKEFRDVLPIDTLVKRVQERDKRQQLVLEFRGALEALFDQAKDTENLETKMAEAIAAIDALEQGTGDVIRAEVNTVRTALGRFAKRAGVQTKAAKFRRGTEVLE